MGGVGTPAATDNPTRQRSTTQTRVKPLVFVVGGLHDARKKWGGLKGSVMKYFESARIRRWIRFPVKGKKNCVRFFVQNFETKFLPRGVIIMIVIQLEQFTEKYNLTIRRDDKHHNEIEK